MSSRSVNGAGTTYSVDDRNQLTAVGADSFTYDAHGNLTYWGASGSWQRTLSYDNENRLIRVEVSGYYIGDYKYDGLGRLRERVEQRWNGSSWVNSTNRYLYDGMLIVQERDGGNVPTVTYTRGKDLSGGLEGAGGIGGLLARTHGYSGGNWSTHSYYHADVLGNVSYLINSSQSMVASYKYDAYGRTITSSGTLASANAMRFSSKLAMDIPSMGLYYYGYRFYEPNLQRWVNRDPIGEEGGNNLFEAFGNNPVSLTDAWGKDVLDPNSINCLGYATDFGYTLGPDPNQSLKTLLEAYGWSCKGPTTKKCKGKDGQRVIVIYVYDTSGFPPGSNPWTSPWPTSGSDFHAIKRCPDNKWRYIPSVCPLNTSPRNTPDASNPDSYWTSNKQRVPKQRYCCTKG
jgi:RHS repeat-associated protein